MWLQTYKGRCRELRAVKLPLVWTQQWTSSLPKFICHKCDPYSNATSVALQYYHLTICADPAQVQQDDGVRVLGLTGLPGVGKSTFATAIFDKLKDTAGFVRSCFVPGVCAAIQSRSAERLQRKMLRDLAHCDLEPLDPLEGERRAHPPPNTELTHHAH
jgi:hypothetical protein